MSSLDVSNEAVADHPAALGQAGSASLSGDLEQAGSAELAELVVGHAAGDHAHPRPCGTQLGQSSDDAGVALHEVGHTVPVLGL
ncbi:hypothetical protein MF672_005875 [Actinomadura sp. ATCC 31491]|uniref:Uncharacterized protein n=1 Tax=Actinomadura luzonensis TaxID=2805427 RepID=A0ABT0FLY2_9ACTN|nr:hypothetical protein [Actinomadura luzonensis]